MAAIQSHVNVHVTSDIEHQQQSEAITWLTLENKRLTQERDDAKVAWYDATAELQEVNERGRKLGEAYAHQAGLLGQFDQDKRLLCDEIRRLEAVIERDKQKLKQVRKRRTSRG